MNTKELGTQKLTDMICDMLNDLPTIVAEDVIGQIVERVPMVGETYAKHQGDEEREAELKRLAEQCRALADQAEHIVLAMEDLHG